MKVLDSWVCVTVEGTDGELSRLRLGGLRHYNARIQPVIGADNRAVIEVKPSDYETLKEDLAQI